MSGSGRFDQKKRNNEPAQQQEAEQEVEETALEGKEPEFARQQNQVGNQAVSSMIAGKAGQGGAGDTAGGVDVAHALKQESDEKEGMEFGGEDDPVEPGPLTISPAAFGASNSIRKFKDRAALRKYMPDDRLPAPDDDFLVAVRKGNTSTVLSHAEHADKFLQPSADVVASSLRSWSEGICYWSTQELAHRCVAQFIRNPPPCIQDGNGRVLLGRARTASAALALLTDSPAVRHAEDHFTHSFIAYCLEICGRNRAVEQFRIEALSNKENRLPLAGKLLSPRLPGNTYQRPKRTLPANIATILEHFLREGLDAWDPNSFLPNFTQQASNREEDNDDPLGLDDVITSILGHGKSREDYQQDAVLASAESLATECARLRIQTAGLGVIISELSEHWLHGSPDAMLLYCANSTDSAVRSALKLLVEVATAAKKKNVEPAGLVNGLRHAAQRIEKISDNAVSGYIDAISAVISGDPVVTVPDSANQSDPLSAAWADGHPAAGLEWLETLPSSDERDFAILLTRADLGISASALCKESVRLREAALKTDDKLIAHICGLIATNGFLQTEQFERSEQLAKAMQEDAWERQNGLAFATATLNRMEVLSRQGRISEALDLRLQAGSQAWLLGAEAAVSLLGRWTPPLDED